MNTDSNSPFSKVENHSYLTEIVTAIKIDVYTGSLYKVMLEKKDGTYYSDIINVIGCESEKLNLIHYFRKATSRQEDLVVEYNAFSRRDMPPSFDFTLNDFVHTIFGNALIVSRDKYGRISSCISTIEEVKKQVELHTGFAQLLQSVYKY